MKKHLFILFALLTLSGVSHAYDFSAVCSTGQTLYYKVNGSTATVTYPNNNYQNYFGFAKPTGNLVIPSSVTHNGTTYTVTSIGDRAFCGCSGLTRVTIPNSVTSIGDYVFSDCTGLTSVTIPNSVTSIGYGAFWGCSGLTGALTIPNSVTSIAGYAFYNCTGLTSVTIPNSVTSIEQYVFSGCTGLTSVTIPNSVTSIGEYAFQYCSGLTSITIPNSVTSIGYWAFNGCSGLTGSLTIPNSVTSIGDRAFSGCSGLTSVTIGNSVTSIGMNAFSFCSGLTTLNFNADSCGGYGFAHYDNNRDPHWLSSCMALTTVNIGNNVRIIPNNAFRHCTGLTSVTIPNSVTSIGDSAFLGCSGLTSVTIPNSVTSIEQYVFSGCSGLTSVTIPNSVTSIGSAAFSGCTGLTSVTIPNSVTSIGDRAFCGCSGLTRVTIPNSVTSIGDWAFQDCSGLTSVTIGNSVTTIGHSAFFFCSGLTSVTIPNSVTSIGYEAFWGCSGLTSVTIGNSVTSIGRYAFGYCTGLTSVTIPNSVTSIGGYAFSGCTGLTTVNFNATNCTYMGYPQLHDVQPVFGGCTNLTTLNIGDNVTYIPNYAFCGCAQLNNISSRNITPPVVASSSSFQDVPREYCVQVPVRSIGAYNTASVWSEFGICGNSNWVTITMATNDAAMGSVSGDGTYDYNTTATLTATPVTGYHFVQWQDGNTDNPRMVTVTSDTTFTATFAINQYTLTVLSDEETMGSVSGGGTYDHNTTATITATPATSYHFVQWQDGNTDSPRMVTVTSDTTFTATFAPDQFTLTVLSDNEAMGSVSGGGTYLPGTPVILTATANEGYHFTQWNDGNTDNPRTVVVNTDTSFTAQFAANEYTVTLAVNDTAMGSTTGAGTYEYATQATIKALPSVGYHFDHWNDGITSALRRVIIVSDISFTAFFAANQYTLTVESNNDAMGSVTGGGCYDYNTTVTLTASANSGYQFVRWNDGNTANPRTVTVTGDARYTAYFISTQGIEDANALSQLAVYPNPTTGLIQISAEKIDCVEVLDLVGRRVALFENTATLDLSNLSNGTYTLRITLPDDVAIRRVVKK